MKTTFCCPLAEGERELTSTCRFTSSKDQMRLLISSLLSLLLLLRLSLLPRLLLPTEYQRRGSTDEALRGLAKPRGTGATMPTGAVAGRSTRSRRSAGAAAWPARARRTAVMDGRVCLGGYFVCKCDGSVSVSGEASALLSKGCWMSSVRVVVRSYQARHASMYVLRQPRLCHTRLNGDILVLPSHLKDHADQCRDGQKPNKKP